MADNNYDSAIFLKSGSFSSAVMLSTPEALVKKVKMYPNPANQILRISADQDIASVMVSDLMGRALRTLDMQSADAGIDLSTMTSGTYIVTFNLSGGGRESQKLVIR